MAANYSKNQNCFSWDLSYTNSDKVIIMATLQAFPAFSLVAAKCCILTFKVKVWRSVWYTWRSCLKDCCFHNCIHVITSYSLLRKLWSMLKVFRQDQKGINRQGWKGNKDMTVAIALYIFFQIMSSYNCLAFIKLVST